MNVWRKWIDRRDRIRCPHWRQFSGEHRCRAAYRSAISHRNARNSTHWTSRVAETTHRPWIVSGSENSTSIHAVLQDSRWPTSSTSGMTLACTATSNRIQMQLFSRIPHSLSLPVRLLAFIPRLLNGNDPFYHVARYYNAAKLYLHKYKLNFDWKFEWKLNFQYTSE